MCVLLSRYGPRKEVEPMVGPAVRLRALGEEVRVCAPLAPSASRRAAELVVAQFDTVAAVAEGCDALLATGVMPAGVRL